MSFTILPTNTRSAAQVACISVNAKSIYINHSAVQKISSFLNKKLLFCQILIDKDAHQIALHFTDSYLPSARKVQINKSKSLAMSLNKNDAAIIKQVLGDKTHFCDFKCQYLDAQPLIVLQ